MRRLFVPLALWIAAVAVDLGYLNILPDAWFSADVGRWIFGIVFLLAWRFRRGRVAFTVLLLAAVMEAARRWGATLPSPSAAVVWVGGGLVLWLGWIAWLSEWRVATQAGLLRLAALAVLVAASGTVLTSPNASLETLRQQLLVQGPLWQDGPTLPIPYAAAAMLLLGGVSILLRFLRQPFAFEAGWLGAWGAIAMATYGAWQQTLSQVDGSAQLQMPHVYLLTAGLMLGASLVEGAFSLAFEDGLTQLPARRALEESLLQLGSQYTLAMVDIDHFKKLNDRHGHEVGDQVLRMVAQILQGVTGGGEAFRYGGEEFTVLFRGKSAAEVKPHLEALREVIADRRFEVRSPGRPKGKQAAKGRGRAKGRGQGPQGKSLRVTVSLGAAQRDGNLKSPELVMKAADKALYRSKKGGRNRLTVAN